MKKILILFLIVVLISGCSELKKAEKTKELMGTIVKITVYDADEEKAEEAINAAFDEIERIDGLLSNYKNDSEVSILNREGFVADVSDDFMVNLKKSLFYADISEGAFDITVQPILDLYTDSFENKKRAPTGEEINKTLKLVGYENIHIKYRNISFLKHGMKITLGGIAKGYAIDKTIEVLVEKGIDHALVDAGGDMRAVGDKGGEEWMIALENPRNKKDYITIIKLSDRSIATSGDYERYFDPERKFHHIVNPKTGYSATELISVTIIADKAIDADAIATAVFVLGPDEGLQLIEELENVEGLLITANREIVKSSGFGSYT